MPNWTLVVTRPARKELEKFPKLEKARLLRIFDELAEDPFRGDVKRLKGTFDGSWRRRVGDYRIIYDIYFGRHLVVVIGIVRRTSATY